MPSLDGYSLNEKIDKLHLEVKEEIVRLREDFTELYKYMKESPNECIYLFLFRFFWCEFTIFWI